jgi:hypothetical protein
MRKSGLIAAMGLACLALATYVVGSASSIAMSALPQPSGPASLIETTHTNADLLAAAKLQNSATGPIVCYRVGWVAVHSAGGSAVRLGEPINVPAGIAPGATTRVPAQAVDPAKFRKANRFLGFFVAEVKFNDGNVWKADLKEIQREAEGQQTR